MWKLVPVDSRRNAALFVPNMSLQGLHERLTALQETTTKLRDLIDRLARLELPCPSPDAVADDEGGELGAEIGQLLRSGLDEQELLWEDLKYARPEGHDKARLKEGTERLAVQLASHRAAFRKARLAAKKKLEEAQKQERDDFIRSLSMATPEVESPSDEASLPPPPPRRPPRQSQQEQKSTLSREDQMTVGASGNVTTALRRTHDLMAAELSRSQFAHQTLTESSAALKQLDESYMSIEGMLASSRDLLGTLLRSQKSDTWYLQTALYLLMATGGWLVFRRLLYGPMWWLLWLPLRTLFGLGSKAGGVVLQASRTDGSKASSAEAEPAVVVVGGLPGDDLPTARVVVGQDGADLDSVLDRVREAVDAVADADGLAPEAASSADAVTEEGNPKKRMWEEAEERVGDKEDYVRDKEEYVRDKKDRVRNEQVQFRDEL